MVKNVYTTPAVQEKLPKQSDEQVGFTDMKINKHFLIAGGTGTGKTNALVNYLVETSNPKKGTFKHIFVCHKVEEALYSFLQEQIGPEGITFYKSVTEFPSVDDFADASTQDPKKQYKYLVVFDDCINDKDKASYTKIKQYFTYGRKKNITVCYLTQSFYDADSFIRKQMSYLLLLSIKGRTDLTNILREYGSLDCDRDELYRIFQTATAPRGDDDLPFLKLNCEKCPKDKKFSRDFTEFITPRPATVEEGSDEDGD